MSLQLICEGCHKAKAKLKLTRLVKIKAGTANPIAVAFDYCAACYREKMRERTLPLLKYTNIPRRKKT